MPSTRLKIEVRGIVQGVGFRPFAYHLAKRLRLNGHILNNKSGVTIEVEGAHAACEKFTDLLHKEAPPLSRIADVSAQPLAVVQDPDFKILHSRDQGDDIALISPDFDVCDPCVEELLDPGNRRYGYPFINCTDCGPRYTLIRKTPYDRPLTSMSGFRMCAECQAEYDDPKNRRFHAQPNACPVCGPAVTLLDAQGKNIESRDPITHVKTHLENGKIVAIKGVGGYHLACDAANEEAVAALRERKFRKEKPFAVMSKDVETIRQYARVNDSERKLLESREKPIVLLKKEYPEQLAPSVAPHLREYGVFLPCTPLHHLLLNGDDTPLALIMTSGNLSEEPIVFEEDPLLERLGGVADYFLTHNRPIVWRCDDSIVRADKDKALLLRRSRGWVPAPVFIHKKSPPMLACGGDLKSVFCLAKGNTVFPGPHMGDLENAEAFDSFRRSIEHFKSIFHIEPEYVVVDKHPRYFSSGYGRSLGLPAIEVQHHHAHMASVMLENHLDEEVIGLALDGTGYGDDHTIWGGEIMVCGFREFTREFHFPGIRLPGGDQAVKEPWRIAVSLLYDLFGNNLLEAHPKFTSAIGADKIKQVVSMLKAGVNCPLAASAGRLFDAVASLLLLRHKNSFDGQAPMLLESAADPKIEDAFDFSLGQNGEIDFKAMLHQLIDFANGAADMAKPAAMFHNTIAQALTACCIKIKKERGINEVCLGGGVFQNIFLLRRLESLLKREGFNVFLPRQLPVNDGGLAVGQLAVALAQIEDPRTGE